MQISVAILFLDACLTLLRQLPMTCLLTVLALALVTFADGGLGGFVTSRRKRLGFVAVPFGLAVLLPLLFFWVCLGLLPAGGGSVVVVAFTDVFLLVVFWWICGTLRSIRGHVGLVDVVMLLSTLVYPCVATFGGRCLATLGSLLNRASCNV